MTNRIDTVKRLVAACEAKDFETVRSLLSDDYTLKDPMMPLNGPEELIRMLESCPFDGRITNAEYFEAGDRVVMIADCVITSPESFTWRMSDVLTVKNGKVVAEEMIYDSAQFPDWMLGAAPDAAKEAKAV